MTELRNLFISDKLVPTQSAEVGPFRDLVVSLIDHVTGYRASIDQYGQVHTVAKGLVSNDNSSNEPLGISGTFTGIAIETLPYAVIVVSVFTDQDSAVDGLKILQSTDGVSWDFVDEFTIPANKAKTFSFQPQAEWLMVTYDNGVVAQTEFRLQTTMKKTYVKPSSHRIQDAIIDQDDAELVKAVITGENPSGIFINFQSTTQGNFKISLEELENAISLNSNTQLKTTLLDSLGNLVEDSITSALKVINYEHHQVHEEEHYFIVGNVDLAINNTRDIQITVPNSTVRTHFTFKVSSEAECEIHFYEGVTINTAGTGVTPRNNDRDSSNTSGITIATIDNTSVANADADTDPTGSIDLVPVVIGSGFQDGGKIERNQEIMLKTNEDYSIRFVATAAGRVNYLLEWYEHTDKV